MEYLLNKFPDCLLNNLKTDSFLIENFIFSILPLTAILSARRGLKTWLKYEIITSIIIGVFLFVKPEPFLSYVLNSSTAIKNNYFFLCNLYGCYLIYSVLGPMLLINSNDTSLFYGHFWSKIISNTLITIDNLISYNEGIHWNNKLLCICTSYFVTSLIINSYFLKMTQKPWGRHPYQDRVNYLAKLEAYMVFTCGVIIYAFPDKALFLQIEQSNEVNRSLSRSCGALLLSLSYESFCVSEFIYLKDKKQFMLSRLFGSLIEAIVILNGYYCHKVYPIQVFYFFMTINTTYNLLVLYGYLITPRTPIAEKTK